MGQPTGIGREKVADGRTCEQCGAPLEVEFADFVTMAGRKVRLKDSHPVCPNGHPQPEQVDERP